MKSPVGLYPSLILIHAVVVNAEEIFKLLPPNFSTLSSLPSNERTFSLVDRVVQVGPFVRVPLLLCPE